MNALGQHTPGHEADGHTARERNLLVVALDAVAPTGVAGTTALVVAPASNSWLRRWLSDEDAARRRAEERAAAVADRLKQTGVHAEGRVGDADPLLAIADALSTFPAERIVIAAEPDRANPTVDELAVRARNRFALPTSLAVTSLFPRAA